MSFGWGGGNYNQAEEEWKSYLAEVARKKIQPQGYNQSYQAEVAGYNQPYQAPAAAYNQPYQPAATPSPVTTPAATPATASGGGTADGKITNDMVTRKGQFYSDYPGTSIGALAADTTGQAARKWAGFYGRGGDAYANYMSSVIKDPLAILRASGVNPGSLVDPQDQLDWQRRLWDIASGRQKVDGGYGYMTGRGMIANILNAKMDNKASSLGSMLNDPSLTPDQQVANTVNLMLGSLQSVISPDALQAYQSTLGRLGQQFIDMKMKDPKSWAKLPFNEFLRQKLGAGGGLY